MTICATAAVAQTPAKISAADQAFLTSRLRLAIAKCWQIDVSRLEQTPAPVTIEFHLKRNGDLAGRPSIVTQRGVATSVILAQTAVDAIQKCAPYTGLPADLYAGGWSRVRMTFDAASATAQQPSKTPAPDPAPRIIKGKAAN